MKCLYFCQQLLLSLLISVTSSTTALWIGLFSTAGCLCFIEIPVFNANSADPDQTPRSDQGLHCSNKIWELVLINDISAYFLWKLKILNFKKCYHYQYYFYF